MIISVITTLYNYGKYIKDTIKSFLKQDFDDSEMIIVDDASTDNPEKVISKYICDKIRYIKLEKNMGYSYAKNVGIKNAKADIIVMLDADDMLTKHSLSIRYKKINKGYDFVHGPVLDLINGHLSASKMWGRWLSDQSHINVHAQGVMLKKDIHKKIGLYDENMRCKSDREMFARIFNYKFNIGCVKEYVAIYRSHAKQMHRSKNKLKNNKKLTEILFQTIELRKKDLSGLPFLQ